MTNLQQINRFRLSNPSKGVAKRPIGLVNLHIVVHNLRGLKRDQQQHSQLFECEIQKEASLCKVQLGFIINFIKQQSMGKIGPHFDVANEVNAYKGARKDLLSK